jgi:hypothetical protein
MILGNPRYTGRQVWNRQSTCGHGGGGRRGGRGSGAVRWNPVEDWVMSEHLAHEPLVDDETFLLVQSTRAVRSPGAVGARRYRFTGLVVCGTCGRRMDGHWVHGRAGYRCRHGYAAARPRPDGAPCTVYRREDRLLAVLPGLLGLPSPGTAMSSRYEDDLIEMLRHRGQMLVCTGDGTYLKAAAPAGSPTRSTRQPPDVDRPHSVGV